MFSAALASILIACNLAACGAPAATSQESAIKLVSDGKLTVVAELGFAPFEYLDNDNKVVGFDVDVANELAKRLGLECVYLPNQQFDTLVPTIAQGSKADISIAAITINDERAQTIDFTEPYLSSNQALVRKANAPELTDVQALNDPAYKIVCQAGTTGAEWITENLPRATMVSLSDVTAGLMGVSTGSYDAMVVDLPVASNLLAQSFSDLKIHTSIPTGEEYGIVVSKANPQLKDALNKALAEMEADGTMAAIKTKWFGNASV